MSTRKRAPINTETDTLRQGMSVLNIIAATSSEEFILSQESSGQKALVNSDVLPIRIGQEYDEFDSKAILEAFGFKFLGRVEGDELFQYVEMLDGWKKVATDHSMWSNLVDEKGRKRAGIFYKAAFYDPRAGMTLERRYNYQRDYEREKRETGSVFVDILDCDEKVKTLSASLPADADKYRFADGIEQQAQAWLCETYPEWRNPGAYWD